MDSDLENLCWQLYLIYEKIMKLNSPSSLEEYFQDEITDDYTEDYAVLGYIESQERYHDFSGGFSLKRQREIPQALNLSLNVPISMPPTINVQQLPQEIQNVTMQLLQQFQNTMVQQIRNTINEEIRRQSRITGINIKTKNMIWKEIQ